MNFSFLKFLIHLYIHVRIYIVNDELDIIFSVATVEMMVNIYR